VQQQQRVEVARLPAQPPVQAGGDGTAGMAAEQRPDRLAGRHRISGMDQRGHRLIGGAQAAGVFDADHGGAGDRAGERDHTRSGRTDQLTGAAGEVDAPVPGQPRFGRRREPPGHRRCAVQRPAVAGGHRHARTHRSARTQPAARSNRRFPSPPGRRPSRRFPPRPGAQPNRRLPPRPGARPHRCFPPRPGGLAPHGRPGGRHPMHGAGPRGEAGRSARHGRSDRHRQQHGGEEKKTVRHAGQPRRPCAVRQSRSWITVDTKGACGRLTDHAPDLI
jgi:hypothetical protein